MLALLETLEPGAHVQDLLGTTFAGANQIVQRLVDRGVLNEITGQARNRRFRYDASLAQGDATLSLLREIRDGAQK